VGIERSHRPRELGRRARRVEPALGGRDLLGIGGPGLVLVDERELAAVGEVKRLDQRLAAELGEPGGE
jgi:hypothetical protein